MKAIFFEKHGGVEVLKYADLPDPTPQPGEVLIKVKAVALNHLDIWVRRGWPGLHLEMPHITGSDVAGDIVAINLDPAQCTGPLTLGARVIVNPGLRGAEDEWTRRGEDSVSPGYRILGEQVRGGLAEYVCVPAANVFKIPDGISYEDAAAPLLVGLTCWRMLIKRAQLKAGESVLIVGAGGGVNSLALLMAKSAGAQVIVVAGGAAKAKQALSLGADSVIDYRSDSNWHAEVLRQTKGRGVDIVIDNVGQETLAKSLRAVTRGGRVVMVGNTSGFEVQLDTRLLFAKQISLIGSTMGSQQDFIDAMQYLWQRGIKTVIDRVEPLAQGIPVIQLLESGKQFGKLVLRP